MLPLWKPEFAMPVVEFIVASLALLTVLGSSFWMPRH